MSEVGPRRGGSCLRAGHGLGRQFCGLSNLRIVLLLAGVLPSSSRSRSRTVALDCILQVNEISFATKHLTNFPGILFCITIQTYTTACICIAMSQYVLRHYSMLYNIHYVLEH